MTTTYVCQSVEEQQRETRLSCSIDGGWSIACALVFTNGPLPWVALQEVRLKAAEYVCGLCQWGMRQS